jgi:hypothetical protein
VAPVTPVAPLAGSTVTLKDAVAVFSWPSTAVQVTVVVPIGKVEPDAGVQLKVRTKSLTPDAVAVYVTAAPSELVASAVMLAGTVIVGGVLLYSSAPMEHGFARGAPRWSVVVQVDESPAPIAGLPGFSECTGVVPPSLSSCFCSSGFVLLSAPTPQLPFESRL